jgi:hypothetical protein
LTPANVVGPQTRLALIAAAPFAVLALNGALITIQNAMAVLFPAWVRLGPIVTTGVEALGQNVLAMIANLLSLGLGLILPLLGAWAVAAWMAAGSGFSSMGAASQLGRPFTITLVVVVASTLLGLETYGAMRFLGRALARAEPLQTG